MIKVFQDSIDRHLPQLVTLDRLRVVIIPKLSSFYDDNQPLSPITTDNQLATTTTTSKQDTQYLEEINQN